jgi:hypothetical protein
MARQAKLFPEPATTIKVDQSRVEPRLWVRRLILWAKPGDPIREVSLRRGLNIVWSPDPGAAAAELGRQGGSGHGAGKTLFCRLLRYCLGEDAFANDELRGRIGTAFPEGLVGAELAVAGSTWGVVRPLGTTRKIFAGEGTPEELLTREGRGLGMKPLLDAIASGVLRAGIDEHMPGGREWRSWLLALAWLARDQECRFGHLLEWRHPDADSRSPASGLSKDEHLTAVRLLLSAMTADEIATRQKLDAAGLEKQRLEREVAYLTQAVVRMGRSLAAAVAVDSSLLTAESLAASAIESSAKSNLRDAEDRLAQGEVDTEGPALRAKLEDVLQQLAVATSLQQRTHGLVEIQQEQMKVLRGERANLDGEEIKARLGPVCPVCNVPIDEALAKGCGLSHVLPDREQITLDKGRVTEQLGACEHAIDQYRQQLRENESLRKSMEESEAHLRGQIRRSEERARALRQQRRNEWLVAAKVAEDARRLQSTHDELGAVRQQIASLEQQEERLKEELQAHRQRQAETFARMAKLFEYVCRGLLGAETDASLSLTGQGLRAEVQVGGTAMESLKAVAFDVAAMLMSIEGRTSLPAFLVHDSPREADLGLSHYHRLFRLMAKLETLGDSAPFQYIVTTTTSPPDEMVENGAVVLRLQGLEPSERLLRRDL